jgi:alpha-D-xyloside xylohydrolase
MLKGLSPREESCFRSPSPTFEAVACRQAEAVVRLRLEDTVPGGASFTGTTSAGSAVSVQLRLVGAVGVLHCRLRAEGVVAQPRLVLARELPPCAVEVTERGGQVVLVGGGRTVTVTLEPAHVSLAVGELVLHQDGTTEDVSGQLVALPLGFTRLTSGALAYHESFQAEPDEHFWGLGERFTGFDKRGQLISCWNHDAFGTQGAQSYKNIPFILSSRGYGLFVDTTTNVHFDCCHSSQAFWSVVAPDEELAYYLVFGSPRQCLAQYQELVGGPQLPPAWVMGAWVSTGDMPLSEDDVRETVDRLDAEDMPCDVYHLDAHWQTFGCWSDLRWDPSRYPAPAKLLAELKAKGLQACLWLNSYIGVESPLFAPAEKAGYFLKWPDGSTYLGHLWGAYHPAVAIIDITNPDACAWWGGLLAERLREGATVFKTDFGEEIPAEVVSFSGLAGPRLHNAYSLLYNDFVTSVMRSEGIERPVVWARSTWAGGQRHVGQWAGDPNSDWRDMASTLRAGLSMALSGHAFWSHDIGGFHGRPDPELYTRWAQFGMLSPLSRFHGTTTRLPWDYGPEAAAAVRAVTRLRYALHPYLYAAAAESVRDAVPIMRPMVLDFPQRPEAQVADLQYLLGPHLLVAPLYRPGGRRLVWAPPGEWLPYSGGPPLVGPGFHEVVVPLAQAPLWLRAGASIPVAPPVRRLGDGRYQRLALALVGGAPVAPTRIALPSCGDLAANVEVGAGGDGLVAVSLPEGWPPLEVVTVGTATSVARVLVNGAPVAARPCQGLPEAWGDA